MACTIAAASFFQNVAPGGAGDVKNILPEKARAALRNEWLRWRLDNVIPMIMRREGIDMWLVINREYNEDPVYMSMMPEPTMSARRMSILIFHDRGAQAGVERLTGSYYGTGDWYKGTWTDKKKDQFDSLAEFIKSRNPQKIGIDVSEHWYFGDGLTAALKGKLEKALGPEYTKRFVSAERLCIGWLETRSPQEMSVYRHLCGIAHDIIGEFYSNKVITPDVTTTEDVVWWIRQRLTELGIDTWFQPSINIQRWKNESEKAGQDMRTIRRGDVLHCDFGIKYLGLCTDMQWQAYVLKPGEIEAPAGLQAALDRANRLADVFLAEFKEGRSGTEVVESSMKKGTDESLRPSIYAHAIGFHGHGAGCTMEGRPSESAPEGTKERGRYTLFPNTAYSIEFSSTSSVPEWDGQDIRIAYEEDALFIGGVAKFIDGRQLKFLLIK
jgi:Xaa-Pro aminopeptidase